MLKKFLAVYFMLSIVSLDAHLSAQYRPIRFKHLSTNDGLSNNRVSSIFKDKIGFMWFGTVSGLNRYDGYEFKVFRQEPGNTNSFEDNNIVWMAEGPNDNLWIKTGSGLSALNIYTEKFVDISNLLADAKVQPWNVNKIIKDQNENYWIASENQGIVKIINSDSIVALNNGRNDNVTDIAFDLNGNLLILHENGQLRRIDINTHKEHGSWSLKGIPNTGLNLSMFVDASGGNWIWSTSLPIGLLYFDNMVSEPKRFDKLILGSTVISQVIESQHDQILVATDHGGVTIIDKSDWSYEVNRRNIADSRSLSHNSAISAYKDPDGMIWIGTNKAGINYYYPKENHFEYYAYGGIDGGVHNDIKALIEDDKGNFWIGTDGAGLMYLDRQTGKYTTYNNDPNDPNSIASDIIVSFEKENDGLWIGTYHGGLNFFDGKKFTQYFNNANDFNALPDKSVWEIFKDSKGNLWVGTLQAGVVVYDKNLKKINHFSLDNGNINSNYVIDLEEDIDGKIWMASSYGIEVYDPKTDVTKHYLNNPSDKNSLADNSVSNIMLSKKGDLWIGTRGGLNRYNRDNDNFERILKKDGLASNFIVSMVEDNDNNIWIGTNEGLSEIVFSNNNYLVNNFDESDGLQGDAFNENSSCKTSNGELAFGGLNGLNVFNPKNIKDIVEEDKLVFTAFYISNENIQAGDTLNDRPLLVNGINQSKLPDLNYYENSFTFEFSALNYHHPEKIFYKYKLEGFDEEWIVTSSDQRRINYTNLDPGNYIFKVKASKGIQDEAYKEIQMAININLPFWKTPFAFLIYAIASIGIFLGVRKIIVDRERLKAKIAQDKLESDRLHQLDLMKIKFFTNISHEFRTPLSLIITPIERIIRLSQNHQDINDFTTIHRNAKRLLTLVNQLLDFRKVESGKHTLSVSGGDFVAFLRDIIESFSDLSREKNIGISFHSEVKEFLTEFDRDKLEKVMYNLLSNAFKFTPNGGKIDVFLNDLGGQDNFREMQVRVIDSGIGISKDNLEKVFDRFFQIDTGGDMMNHGSGIGLSIAKDFIALHKGQITVESEPGQGSAFKFVLPLKVLTNTSEIVPHDQNGVGVMGKGKERFATSDLQYTVLVVDDNADFRYYLRENMVDHFNVLEAENGKVAWKMILDKKPDLIVSDIMMPVMDGYELTTKVKSDPRTIHLPIILLTAHSSDASKIEGLEAGAIEFLTKPFNFEILISSIKSSLRFQEQIRKSEHQIEVSPSEIDITSLDEKLIQSALRVVEENISNPDFSVQELSRELGVSRGQLYKKILAITGQTPIEFIRYIRLKRAILLLEKSQLTVAEVAYKVGFNNPRYFTKYFKAAYNTVPSKYIKKKEVN